MNTTVSTGMGTCIFKPNISKHRQTKPVKFKYHLCEEGDIPKRIISATNWMKTNINSDDRVVYRDHWVNVLEDIKKRTKVLFDTNRFG